MNSPERFALLNRQDRAFITGTVEKLNDQWVFLMMRMMKPLC
ncbi:hypothetical protein [Bacillus coahuilensis]|nr:hypothetical protein [Bacillus coahuilensis]